MIIFTISLLLTSSVTAYAGVSDGTVKSFQKISATEGNFDGEIPPFGSTLTNIGDFDKDGVPDLAVGGGEGFFLIFLNADGTVKDEIEISQSAGTFTGPSDVTVFGAENIGDLDGDGVIDLAVAATGDDDGGVNKGAVWIIFLNADGTVKAEQKISQTQGGFTGQLSERGGGFGKSIAGLGDLDGDGVKDIAVGSRGDDDDQFGDCIGKGISCNKGAVWILFLNTDGTVKSHQKISEIEGNFGGKLEIESSFGEAVENIGDLNEDGIIDLAVGAIGACCPQGEPDRPGSVWILFLNKDGTVKDEQKISEFVGGFNQALDENDSFGDDVAYLGDVDGDGIQDLAVGVQQDDDDSGVECSSFQEPPFCNRGAVYILFMNKDGTVKDFQKISDTEGGFLTDLDNGDIFGNSITSLGDFDNNGVPDFVVGALRDDDGGVGSCLTTIPFFPRCNLGAVYILFLNEGSRIAVGGELLPLETTSLLLASAQTFSWMIPVILSVLGIGLFVVSRKSENS